MLRKVLLAAFMCLGASAFSQTVVPILKVLGKFDGYLNSCSADGSIAVGGNNATGKTFRYDPTNGFDYGIANPPYQLSNDGLSGATYGGLWTASGGLTKINPLPGYNSSSTTGISGDGTTVIGRSVAYVYPSRYDEAFSWSSGQLRDLGYLPYFQNSQPLAASSDASVIVGYCYDPFDQAFTWNLQTGMQPLSGPTPSRATTVSSDGHVAGGYAGNANVLWRDGNLVSLGVQGATFLSLCDDGSIGLLNDGAGNALLYSSRMGVVNLSDYLLRAGSSGVTATTRIRAAQITPDGTKIAGSASFNGSVFEPVIISIPHDYLRTGNYYNAVQNRPLTVGAPGVLYGLPAGSTAALTKKPAHGTLTLAADGSFTYQSNTTFYGKETFQYTPTVNGQAGTATTVTVSVVPELIGFVTSSSRARGGSPLGGSVQVLDPNPSASITFTTTDNSLVPPPPPVAAYGTDMAFTINTNPTVASKSVGIYAYYLGVKRLKNIIVDPAGIASATIPLTRIHVGLRTGATITLSGLVAAGGAQIQTSTTRPDLISMPASVSLAEGASRVYIPITCIANPDKTLSVSVTFTLNGTSAVRKFYVDHY